MSVLPIGGTYYLTLRCQYVAFVSASERRRPLLFLLINRGLPYFCHSERGKSRGCPMCVIAAVSLRTAVTRRVKAGRRPPRSGLALTRLILNAASVAGKRFLVVSCRAERPLGRVVETSGRNPDRFAGANGGTGSQVHALCRCQWFAGAGRGVSLLARVGLDALLNITRACLSGIAIHAIHFVKQITLLPGRGASHGSNCSDKRSHRSNP